MNTYLAVGQKLFRNGPLSTQDCKHTEDDGGQCDHSAHSLDVG